MTCILCYVVHLLCDTSHVHDILVRGEDEEGGEAAAKTFQGQICSSAPRYNKITYNYMYLFAYYMDIE